MSFDQLNINKPLRNAIEDLGLEAPTPIQAESYAPIMSGKDVVGVAQTGTGKTFAYLLPILRQLKFSKKKHPRVLIVVPTRELVVQVVGEIQKLTAYMTVRIKGAYGGVNIRTQAAELSKGMDILVATPGRLVDLGLNRAVKLKQIKQLVIDEVDEMLQLGFRTQLETIFDLLPKRHQNILFSATLTDDVEKIINTFFFDPQKIEIAASGTSAEGITQHGYLVPNFQTKINLLRHLLLNDERMKKVLIFAPTKKRADHLFELLHPTFEEKVGIIHSNKSQNYRLRTVKHFDEGKHHILLATDIIARGLDFEGITHVINFDTPDNPENYIHRIGRTARADAEGTAITLTNQREATEETTFLEAILDLIDTPIDFLPLPTEVEVSEEIADHEIVQYHHKNPAKAPKTLQKSQGAFHEKLDKNKKVNRAQERRRERMIEKKKAKRKKK